MRVVLQGHDDFAAVCTARNSKMLEGLRHVNTCFRAFQCPFEIDTFSIQYLAFQRVLGEIAKMAHIERCQQVVDALIGFAGGENE